MATMSRRMPPIPVAAPWNGSTAEGWLCDSTLNATATPSPRSRTPAFSPGPCSTRSPLEGSRRSSGRRVLVAAVLGPEEREDGELEVVRVAAEELPDSIRLPVGETEGAVERLFRNLRQVMHRNRGWGRAAHALQQLHEAAAPGHADRARAHLGRVVHVHQGRRPPARALDADHGTARARGPHARDRRPAPDRRTRDRRRAAVARRLARRGRARQHRARRSGCSRGARRGSTLGSRRSSRRRCRSSTRCSRSASSARRA